jgi:hypothetical protein
MSSNGIGRASHAKSAAYCLCDCPFTLASENEHSLIEARLEVPANVLLGQVLLMNFQCRSDWRSMLCLMIPLFKGQMNPSDERSGPEGVGSRLASPVPRPVSLLDIHESASQSSLCMPSANGGRRYVHANIHSAGTARLRPAQRIARFMFQSCKPGAEIPEGAVLNRQWVSH